MGREKDRLIFEEERGWYSSSNRNVCEQCVREEALAQFIRDLGSQTQCHYCGLKPDDAEFRAIPFDTLLERIAQCIYENFNSADDEMVIYDSSEGGYQWETYDTYDLVTDVIELDAAENVIDDIIQALPDQVWVQKDFASLNFSEALRSGWEAFVDQVKHHTRYLFTEPALHATDPNDSSVGIGAANTRATSYYPPSQDETFGIEYSEQDGIPAARMLDAIGSIIRQLDLTREIARGRLVFRARVHADDEHLLTASQLGPPSIDHAKQSNRMSPAGIVMFYGAFERDTAIKETFQADRPDAAQKLVTVAEWEVQRPLLVLDLTRLPSVPSLFTPDIINLRHGISFLHGFVEDLTKPVARDGMEHIDYVPTQIVTEYFRYRLRTRDGQSLDGVVYSSARLAGGTACVLFLDQSHCGVETSVFAEKAVLSLQETKIQRIEGRALIS